MLRLNAKTLDFPTECKLRINNCFKIYEAAVVLCVCECC